MHPRHDFCCSKQEGETPETPPGLRALQNVKGHEFYPQAPKKTFPGEHCFTGVKTFLTWLVETHLKANQRKTLYPAGRMVFMMCLLDRVRPPRPVWQSASVEMEMYRVWVSALIKSQLHNQSWWGTTLHSLEHMLFTVDDKMSVLLFFVLPGIQSLCLSVIGFWESQIHPSFMLMNYWASRESSQSGWKSDDELTKEKIHWHEQRCFSFFFLPPNTRVVEDKYNHGWCSSMQAVMWCLEDAISFSCLVLALFITQVTDRDWVYCRQSFCAKQKTHTKKKPCVCLFIVWNTVRFGINPIQ